MNKKDVLLTIVAIGASFGGYFGWVSFKDGDFTLAMLSAIAGLVVSFALLFSTSYLKIFMNFMGGVKYELNRIEWSNRGEVLGSFVVVVIFSFVFAGLIFLIDAEFKNIYQSLFL